jgi:hypothetical protein
VLIVVCIIVHASGPAYCVELEESDPQVDISGVYQLEEVENYEEYLLAMEIPPAAVRHIKMIKGGN